MRLLFFLSGLFLQRSFIQAQAIDQPKLTVSPLSDRVYVHTTYGMYGKTPFPSNGLIIKTGEGVVLVDTGWDSDTNTDNTKQIRQWVADNLHLPVRLCIVTHAHEDRVGGISELRRAGVRVISTPLTSRKSEKLGLKAPEGVLSNDTTFIFGQEPFRCYFPGEGHTNDNMVVWLPNQQILFGGCLVKSVAAFGMGNLADANVNAWSTSIRKLKTQFGMARIVVPGHQEWSDSQSLDHTLQVVEKHLATKKK